MKLRNGFISNSSSCSFIISNNSNSDKKLLDFAKETIYLLHKFNKEYYSVSEKDFLKNAKNLDLNIPVGSNIYIFGDEYGGILNTVYDYMLRDGGSSENFSWEFEEFLR